MGSLPLGCCCPILLRRDRQIRRKTPGSGDPGRARRTGSGWQVDNTQEGDYQEMQFVTILSAMVKVAIAEDGEGAETNDHEPTDRRLGHELRQVVDASAP